MAAADTLWTAVVLILPALFHWAPAERGRGIRERGLVPGAAATVCSGPIDAVCLSPDPLTAWELSGAMDHVSFVELWDLWRVELADVDEVTVQAAYGPVISEVRITSPIPPQRLWLVGRRVVTAAV